MSAKSTILTSSSPSSRQTYSCVRCSDRKVRCDRQNPCSACVKHNFQCVFRPPPPPRRKQKRIEDDNLRHKLKRCEALLQELGIDPNGSPKTSEAEQRRLINGSEAATTEITMQMPMPASTAPEIERSITTPQLLLGQERSQFVDK